jgi:hypothetical protein
MTERPKPEVPVDKPQTDARDVLDGIDVDYENLDVSVLMDRIRKAAAAAPGSETGAAAAPPGGPPPDPAAGPPPAPPAPDPGPAPAGVKSKLQGRAIRLLTPFFPIMRLIGLPLHQELRETQQSLHATNIRIDGIVRELGGNLDEARRDLNKSQEYIKLLHNLSHNLILTATSQKIELDMLKSKVRVLEKELEFAERRERALEEEILK